MPIQVRLKYQKDAIAALLGEGYTVEPIRFCRGDHLFIKVSKDGQSIHTTLAGSPKSSSTQPVLTTVQRHFQALKAG